MTPAFVMFEVVNHMGFVLAEAHARGLAVVVLHQGGIKETGPYGVRPSQITERVAVRWSDAEGVSAAMRDVHRRYDVVGTYAAVEPTMPYEAALREWAGLPTNDEATVRRVLDKALVRRILLREGLSDLRYATLEEALRWDHWPFPGRAVLKPTHGLGSALCFTVTSLPELRGVAQRLDEKVIVDPVKRDYVQAGNRFLLEAEAAGELLSVESLVYQGRVQVIGLSGREVLASDPVVELGSLFPYPHPRFAEIVDAAEAIHQVLGVVHGPTHLEMMVPDRGRVELVDFNIRCPGQETLVEINLAFDVRFQACLVDLALGKPPDLSFLGTPKRYTADAVLLPPRGETVLREIEFPAEAVFQRYMREPGTPLSGRADQMDSVGIFVVLGNSAGEAHRVSLAARRRARVNGILLGDNINNVPAYPRHMDIL